ncbi:MAG: hypothetical protein PVI30_17970, partial [Myxococcales bacterium]
PGASSSAPGGSSGDEVSGPTTAVHKTGNKEVAATLGSAGGTLELSGGPRVEVPAGAIDEPMDFVLKEAPMTTAFFNSEHERPWGPTFVFSPGVNAPDGTTITVSVPLAAYPEGWGDVAIAYEYPVGDMVGAEDAQHTKWQYEDASHTGGRAVAELPAVNGYRLQFVIANLEAQ